MSTKGTPRSATDQKQPPRKVQQHRQIEVRDVLATGTRQLRPGNFRRLRLGRLGISNRTHTVLRLCTLPLYRAEIS